MQSILWFPSTNYEEDARQRIPSKTQLDDALPEAVFAEGMPARELDRTGPLAQADAAALIVIGPVHLVNTRCSFGRRCDSLQPSRLFSTKSRNECSRCSSGPRLSSRLLPVQSVLPLLGLLGPRPPAPLCLCPKFEASLSELVNRGARSYTESQKRILTGGCPSSPRVSLATCAHWMSWMEAAAGWRHVIHRTATAFRVLSSASPLVCLVCSPSLLAT